MKRIQIYISILLLLVITGGIFYLAYKKLNPSREAEAKDEHKTKVVGVKAEGGTVSQYELTTELFTDIDLEFTAVDRDYEFKIDGYPRLNTNIKKGETKKILINSLGVGEYIYSCGQGCSGKIIVNQQTDLEDIFN